MNKIKSSPELSIVVPVYNSSKFLRKAVDSLLNQTYKNIEVILINDGSIDDSGEICDEYAQRDSRVKVLHKKNEGQGIARNIGIKMSTGIYLTFLDSDDYLDLKTYEYVVATTKKYNLDINRFCYSQFYEETQIKKISTYVEPKIYEDNESIRQAALCIFSRPINNSEKDLNLGGSACCAIYKRSLIINNNISFPNNKEFVCEDFLFNYYCLCKAERIGKSSSVLYYYRINPISTTHKPNLEIVKKCVHTCEYLENKFLLDGYDTTSIYYAQGFIIEALRAYLKNIFMSSMPLSEKINWAIEQSNLDYIKKVEKLYNWKNLPVKHKLYFRLFVHKRIFLLYLLIVGQEKFRKIKKFVKYEG